MSSVKKNSNSFHLSADQGSSEARTELYSVLRGSTGAADAGMHQEFWQSFGLCSKPGQNGGGV